MNANIDYVALPDLDSAANGDIIAFANGVLAHEVNAKVWDWEFGKNKGAVFTVAKDGDVIAGTQSMLSEDICKDGKRIKAAKSETSYLSGDYRGKKIFEQLYELAIQETVKNGTEVIWGFTPAVKAWKKNLGFYVYEESMSNTVLYTYSCDMQNAIAKSSNALYGFAKYFKFRGQYNSFLGRCKQFLNTSIKLDASSKLKSTDDLDQLYQQINNATKGLIHLCMDERFVNWRVNNNPVLQYKQLYFYSGSELAGYVMYTISKDHLSIADATYNLDENILKYMLSYLVSHHKEAFTIEYWGNRASVINDVIFDTLEKLGGSTQLDKGRNFVCQLYNDKLARPGFEDMSKWYINGLWTEGFDK